MRQRILLAGTVAIVCTAAWALADALEDTLYIPLDQPAIQYSKGPANDPVGRLDKQLESGKAKLDYTATNGWGYLPSLLKQLGVNIDSQVLVFSRTSIQTSRISPAHASRDLL